MAVKKRKCLLFVGCIYIEIELNWVIKKKVKCGQNCD
jgi:hypothetical protein